MHACPQHQVVQAVYVREYRPYALVEIPYYFSDENQ